MTPRKQEKLFPQEYSVELMAIARDDFKSANALATVWISSKSGRPENILFMAQQALEKALKAVLCKKGLPIPLVHDVGILIAKLPAEPSPPFGYELASLNEFAAIRRYQQGSDIITPTEISESLAKVDEALNWCESQLS